MRARGAGLIAALSPFDAGQAVVVANGRVLAVEAAEGTDSMLARIADLRAARRLRLKGRAGVLVKAPKRDQDMRLDMPAVGLKTIEGAKRAELEGIALAAGRVLIADRAAFAQRRRRGRPVRFRAGDVSVPAARALRIFLVVGEHSGDQLGFKLMRALREATGGAIAFSGVGGEAMQAEGLQSLFPLTDIAVMGILPVIARLPTLLARIRRDGGGDHRRAARRAGDHRQS